MLGGSPGRNLANPFTRGLPLDWDVRNGREHNVKWAARLGTQSFGGPVLAAGRVFVGTNNDRPRDPAIKGDRGVLMCFRESDGLFLWQIVHDKMKDGDVNDYPRMGVASTPCVDGDCLYYVSNRCELVCADVKGDEKASKGKILWIYDLVKELDVFPCQLAISSPVVVDGLVYAVTGNGVDASTGKLPRPKAPAFVALHKRTGKLAWSSNLPGAGVMRGQWSSPAAAPVAGKMQVLFAGGDGWLYGFAARSGELLWKFDLNPRRATPYKPGGGGERCFPIASPVVVNGLCYIATGQEPDDGDGVGHLWCIDITKKPRNKQLDLSPVNDNFDPKAEINKDSGLVWHHGGLVMPKPKGDEREIVFGRTISWVVVHDGLAYAAELTGYLHCMDAKTGRKYWEHDFEESTWCSPFYADGRVFIGTDSGDLYAFAHGKKATPPKKVRMRSPIKAAPVAANGVLYINTGGTLYALAKR